MEQQKRKVLVVDDDSMTRGMYVDIFQGAGYEVVEAKDGVEGLDIATRDFPDLIFTGIIMPRMDGFSMIEELKKTIATANIPVIISSHMGREEDQKRAIQLGAKDFIVRDTTPPFAVLERIGSVFLKAGGVYTVEINPFAMDAQKLAKELSFNPNFLCLECGEKMAMLLKLTNPADRIFEARVACPKCGWVAK